MISLQFSDQDLTDIDEACDNPDLPEKIKRKLKCLKMHQQKVTNTAITRVLNISANTVTSYIREFRDQGIAGVLEDRSYSPSSCLEPFLPCLRGSFTAELSPRLEEAAKGERKVFFVDAANTVELLFLPAYSPNLNLIERLWKHLKKKSLKNKHFKDFAMFRAAIDAYLDNLGTTCQDELESLLTLKFQSSGNHKMS